MSSTRTRPVLNAAFATLAAVCATPAAAEEVLAPTPRVVIYPGDVIHDDMLADISGSQRRIGTSSSSGR